jgi:glycosyltransferase involved in cell wall biosynthesis
VTAPVLSVVIPTWNRARLVCEAIESAFAQRPGAVEVIVVDDESTDNTQEALAERFGSSIKLLRMPRRCGPGAARNAGVRVATGELLAFLDSDDVWLPGKLDAELRMFERFPDAEAVVSDSLAFFEGRPDDCTRFVHNGLLAAAGGQVRRLSECRWPWTDSRNGVATCSITVRREALSRLGPTLFAEDIACCEDWEFEMRVYHACHVVVLPEVWSHIRRFDDGTRIGRAIPGQPPTREEEIGLLRARLRVMERSHWLNGIDAYLANELARFRADTVRQLAMYAEGELALYAEGEP